MQPMKNVVTDYSLPHWTYLPGDGPVGLSAYLDIEMLREVANGTSNRVPLVAGVPAGAPVRVQHPQTRLLSGSSVPRVAIEDLP